MDSLVCTQITPTRMGSKTASQSLHMTPSTRSIPIYVQRSPRTPAEQSGSRCKKWSVLCASSSQAEQRTSTSNPFDVDPDQLTLPSCSPSMFSSFFSSRNKQSSSSTKSFRWSIEQMSQFWPADIDEESIQFFCSRNDEEYEMQSQQAIEKYFSQQDIVPSPWVADEKNAALPSPAAQSSSCKTANRTLNDRRTRKRTVWSQTLLTIPPSVDVESVLGRYFTFNCDQREQGHRSPPVTERSGSLRDSFGTSLRRKLFCNGVEDSPVSSGGSVGSPTSDGSSSRTDDYGCPLRETPASLNLCSSPIPPLRASSQGTTPLGEPMQLSPICRTDRRTTPGNKHQDRDCSKMGASVVSRSPKSCHSDDEGPSEESSPPPVPDERVPTVQLGSRSLREDFNMSTKDDCSESSGDTDRSTDSQCGRIGTVGRRSSDMDTGYQTYNSNGKLDSITLRLPSAGPGRRESGVWRSLVLTQQTDDV